MSFDFSTTETPRFVELPKGGREVVVLSIERAAGGRPHGFIVAGLSPLLRRSPSYDRFHNLVAGSISQIVSNAATLQEERMHAESLAALDRAKTTFFSNISHEFRTPLTLMLGPLEGVLADPDLPPSFVGELATIHRNALRLLKLVNTMLDFSRIEAGRATAQFRPVDLPQLTSDLASVFRAATEKAGLAFVIDCPLIDNPVPIDVDMREKIVLNLASNAFKFTHEGEIAVALARRGDHVELSVRDSGTGIPALELPHVFERFPLGSNDVDQADELIRILRADLGPR